MTTQTPSQNIIYSPAVIKVSDFTGQPGLIRVHHHHHHRQDEYASQTAWPISIHILMTELRLQPQDEDKEELREAYISGVRLTHLHLQEVELSCTGVHHRVKVLVAGELGLDQTADVSLKQINTGTAV